MIFGACRSITWASGRGFGPWKSRVFLGPVKWHRADNQYRCNALFLDILVSEWANFLFSFSGQTFKFTAVLCLPYPITYFIKASILFGSKPPAPYALPLGGVWPDPESGVLAHLPSGSGHLRIPPPPPHLWVVPPPHNYLFSVQILHLPLYLQFFIFSSFVLLNLHLWK